MNKFGLALGGGGTKGAYHIGVWNALQKMNIDVCAVCGTSIGSVNGAVIAQGQTELAMNLWNNISMSDIIKVSEIGDIGENLFDTKNLATVLSAVYKNNGIETEPFRKLLTELIDEERIRNSDMDFGLVTYSLDDFEGVELFIEDIPEGKLVDYLLASAAMPGLKQPIIDDKKYIDGAFSDNIPASMMIKKGINNIITVDVGGFGLVKGIEVPGVNHISIKCSENIVGLFDFNEKNISKMMLTGYFDTMKAFARLEGEIYSFNISDYHNQRLLYSQNIISGIEIAAKILEIDKLKVYKFDELKNTVVEEVMYLVAKFSENDSKGSAIDGLKLNEKQLLTKFVYHIMKKEFDSMSNKIFQGLLGEVYQAANAVVYFVNINKS